MNKRLYKISIKKLSGKKLDKEIEWRQECRQKRIKNRLSLRDISKKYNIKCSDVCIWERGQDVCPHKEYEVSLGGIIPEYIFKQCKKCKYVDPSTVEKINNKNIKRAYGAYKRITKNSIGKEGAYRLRA